MTMYVTSCLRQCEKIDKTRSCKITSWVHRQWYYCLLARTITYCFAFLPRYPNGQQDNFVSSIYSVGCVNSSQPIEAAADRKSEPTQFSWPDKSALQFLGSAECTVFPGKSVPGCDGMCQNFHLQCLTKNVLSGMYTSSLCGTQFLISAGKSLQHISQTVRYMELQADTSAGPIPLEGHHGECVGTKRFKLKTTIWIEKQAHMRVAITKAPVVNTSSFLGNGFVVQLVFPGRTHLPLTYAARLLFLWTSLFTCTHWKHSLAFSGLLAELQEGQKSPWSLFGVAFGTSHEYWWVYLWAGRYKKHNSNQYCSAALSSLFSHSFPCRAALYCF